MYILLIAFNSYVESIDPIPFILREGHLACL